MAVASGREHQHIWKLGDVEGAIVGVAHGDVGDVFAQEQLQFREHVFVIFAAALPEREPGDKQRNEGPEG